MPVVKLEDLEVTEALSRTDPAVPAAKISVESDVERDLERAAVELGSELRRKGYKMYLQGRNPGEIAVELKTPSVTTETVLLWARDGEWAVRLRKRNDAHEKLVRENVRRQRLEHAEEEVKSSLRISQKIRKRAEEMIDKDKLTPMGLKNVADAAKATGDLGAHGMGEVNDAESAEGPKAKGKTPLVFIFPAGGLPPAPKEKEAEVIEV